MNYTVVKKKEGFDFTKLLKTFCFSQRCEDYLVNLIFENKKNGTFIDVGSHDGIRFSNSYAFSKLGWKGLCIEAHPDYYNICKKNREDKNNKILNYACTDNDNDSVTLYSNYRGSMSTLNTNLNQFYKKTYSSYYIDSSFSGKVQGFTNGPLQVQGRTLNTLIQENTEFLGTQFVDLLSIDVDGSEEFVFRGFDIMKYRPRVVILEVSVVRKVVENYMKNTGYYKLWDNKLNAIYCRDKEDRDLFTKNLIATKNKKIIAYDTIHPLD